MHQALLCVMSLIMHKVPLSIRPQAPCHALQLISLNLKNNSINGTLPSSWSKLPQASTHI